MLDPLLQLLGGHLGLLERRALDAMGQGQFSRQGDVVIVDSRAAFKGCLGPRSLQDDQVGAMPVHVQRSRQRSDRKQITAGVGHLVDDGSRHGDLLGEFLLLR